MGKSGDISKIFINFAADFRNEAPINGHFWRQKQTKFNKMTTFIGNIEARLDEKGRIFIPAAYRKILAEYDSRRIVLRRDTENDCLIFYPEEVWNEKVTQLKDSLDEWNPEDEFLLMQFTSDAEFLEMDSQGRVLLQKRNLEQINAQQDVLFVGMMNRFALWAPSVFEERKMQQKDFAALLRQRMAKKA